ncbi:MAG: hypothetical protein ACHREM_04300 [Polyangiales bacterium]
MAALDRSARTSAVEDVSLDDALDADAASDRAEPEHPAYVWVKFAAEQVPANGLDYVAAGVDDAPSAARDVTNRASTEHHDSWPFELRFRDEAALRRFLTTGGPATDATPDAEHPGALPEGMTTWVTTRDVMSAMSCSRSKAHEYLRAAAGRSIGTGHQLRVPVDVWEAWARNNVIDGRRGRRWESAARTGTLTTSTSAARSGGVGTTTTKGRASDGRPEAPTRRPLASGSPNGSVKPQIPTLRSPRR